MTHTAPAASIQQFTEAEPDEIERVAPVIAPVATRTSFVAHWEPVDQAIGYRLDVSTRSDFSSFVDGYRDLDVGKVTARTVTRLDQGTTYYYRVRAYTVYGNTSPSAVSTAETTPTSGLIINATFDPSILNASNSATLQATINQTIGIYESLFSDPITIQIYFRYATTWADGSPLPSGALAQSSKVTYGEPWNTVIDAMRADAKDQNDSTANASLPTTALTSNITIGSANGRALGLNTPPAMFSDGSVAVGGPYDGIVTLNSSSPFQFTRPTSANSYDASRSLQHEIDEVMGLSALAGVLVNGCTTKTLPQDLFSWSSPGARNTCNYGNRYFSINGGNTSIVSFNQGSGDYGDWLSSSCPQSDPYVQNAFGCPGQYSDISATSPEGINLDVVGYDLDSTSYTITTSSSPSNGGTTTGGGTYSAGSSRTVTATANSGYSFVSWTENGSTVSTSSSYTFTLSRNRTLVANFSTINYTITTSSSPSGGGTTTGGGIYSAGSSHTVTATPNSGYAFVSWTENGSTVSTSSSYTFTLNSNRNLVANFSVTYTITTSSSPSAGGTTTGSGTFPSGSSRTVTATANSGYAFVSWTQGGSIVSTSASYTFTLNSNRTLVANFETISTPSTPSGSTSGSTGLSYSYSTGGSSSNLGHSVQYQFDWGDGSVSGWLAVGTTGTSHVWAVAGTYSVKAQARCSTDNSAVSLLSTAISVKINFVPSGVSVADGAVIGLVANADGMFVTAEDMGNSPLIANRPGLGAWEQFQIFDLGDGTIALKSLINGKIVSAANGGNSPLIANRDTVGTWEQFRLQDAGNGNFVIVARANGKYVCAEDGGKSPLIANRTSAGGWEQFRMVFRPSVKPFNVTASFQAGGGGYISAGTGGNASLTPSRTSEGGSEQFQINDVGNGNVAIRSLANGRYVTAENYGKDPLVANRDAIGTWEQFQLFDAGAGMIALRAVVNGQFVSVNNTGEFLIANRTYVGALERFFLNISLRAVVNTAFVCPDNYGNDPLIANRPSIGVWEQFQVVNTGDGNFGLKAKVNGMYVCAENFGKEPLIANRPSVGLWETFQWINVGNGNIELKAAVNGMFVCAEDQGRKPLIANRSTASVWEQFH